MSERFWIVILLIVLAGYLFILWMMLTAKRFRRKHYGEE